MPIWGRTVDEITQDISAQQNRNWQECYKKSNHLQNSHDRLEKEIEILKSSIRTLEDKIEVLAERGKQRFRWVREHWELVDDVP